jgi:Type ISP C-terminal specificity domain
MVVPCPPSTPSPPTSPSSAPSATPAPPLPKPPSTLPSARLLEDAGAPLTETQRAGVFLTNALTGWVPETHPQSVLSEEFRREREDSEHIKQQETILVILGNPPYNGYAGIARIEEERDLTTAYRAPIAGLPAPQGQGLNDLYIRFFRIAERRIAANANGQGIVSFISNNAWLDGLSHTTMRHLYLHTFQQIFIDNLNGDKYRTGKTTPDGKPDPSAFSTPQNREGIQVGTAIATLVRNTTTPTPPAVIPTPNAVILAKPESPYLPSSVHPNAESAATTPSAEGATTYQPGPKAQVPAPMSPQRAESPTHNSLGRRPRSGDRETPRAEGPAHPAANAAVTIHLRDIWGTTKLSHLERESRREAEPTYTTLNPTPALGNPFANRIHSAAYTSWPRLPELFPISFPGIQTGRDAFLVEIDRDVLRHRLDIYLDPQTSDAELLHSFPVVMKNSQRFNASQTRATLMGIEKKAHRQALEMGSLTSEKDLRRQLIDQRIQPYCYRPFDLRWLYWEMHTKLLDEKRDEYVRERVPDALAFAAAQSSRTGYDPPPVTKSLGGRHLVERGANIFPVQALQPTLFHSNILQENLADVLLGGTEDQGSAEPYFFHALATMHTPQYRLENSGALLGDWPRIPLPATADLLAHSASLGHHLAELLDPESSINLAAEWSFLAALKRPSNALPEETLKITAGWGSRGQGSTVMPGRGRLAERPWTPDERKKLAILEASQSLTLEAALTLLGETCVDIYLNAAPSDDQTGQSVFWSAIPIHVWNYTLGGYQVLKKWLSYREHTLLGRPLHEDEARYFAQVARRIAAILLLGPALDASYQAILPTATGLPTRR